jgi:fructose-1-phosphate kinase PfkB-like protein
VRSTSVAFAAQHQTPIVISLGADGAIAANQREVRHVRPPQLTIESAVGSGDSTVAGIIYGLTHGSIPIDKQHAPQRSQFDGVRESGSVTI